MSTLGARVWPWVPALLLACMLAGLGTMAALAVRDPGFALERDYYKKAVSYDREIAQRAENARLRWSAAVSVGGAVPGKKTVVDVRLSGATDPLTGAHVGVEALRNATAGRVLESELVEVAPGLYRAELPLGRGGLWEFRLTFEHGHDRMTEVVRRDVEEIAP